MSLATVNVFVSSRNTFWLGTDMSLLFTATVVGRTLGTSQGEPLNPPLKTA